jgi:hypothetical protein
LPFVFGLAFVDSSCKKRKRERERNFLLCEFLPLYDKTKKKIKKKGATQPKDFLGVKYGTKFALPKYCRIL